MYPDCLLYGYPRTPDTSMRFTGYPMSPRIYTGAKPELIDVNYSMLQLPVNFNMCRLASPRPASC